MKRTRELVWIDNWHVASVTDIKITEGWGWSSLKEPHWQQYWWRLLFRADGEPGWTVIGPGPVSQVPNAALKKTSLEEWAHALLEEAPSELDDLCGDLLLECYDEPAPADGSPPVYSRRVRLAGG